MKLHLIRNATLRLQYAGHELLIDPWLAERHSLPSFGGHGLNPTVPLPLPVEELLRGVETLVVSHLHPDHIDLNPPLLPRDLPLLCAPVDASRLRDCGFTQVRPVESGLTWGRLRLEWTGGAHGTGAAREAMGEVSGFVLRAPGEPTVYWAGDTVLTDEVRATIRQVQPDLIVTHSGGAAFRGIPIIMDAAQTVEVCTLAPQALVVAVHLEAIDHASLSRVALRAAAQAAGVAPRLRVPEDGEVLHWTVGSSAQPDASPA